MSAPDVGQLKDEVVKIQEMMLRAGVLRCASELRAC